MMPQASFVVSFEIPDGQTLQRHPNIVDMLDHFDIETDDSVHGCIMYELLKIDVKKVLEDKGGGT